MRDILDLDRYPLDRPGSEAWHALVARCRAGVWPRTGCSTWRGFCALTPSLGAMSEIEPVMERLSFLHKRSHR